MSTVETVTLIVLLCVVVLPILGFILYGLWSTYLSDFFENIIDELKRLFTSKKKKEEQRLAAEKEKDELNEFFLKYGTSDFEKLKSFMLKNNIPLPSPERRPYDYFMKCFEDTRFHFRRIFDQSMENAGYDTYYRSFRLRDVGKIYYKSDEILIFPERDTNDIYDFLFHVAPVKSDLGYGFSYKVAGSLDSVFEKFKEVAKVNSYKKYAKVIPARNVYWYVHGGNSGTYKAIDAAAGAIVGGLLFGGVGALLGAASIEKDDPKKKKIIFGIKNEKYWVFDMYMLDTFQKHLPGLRCDNQYTSIV